MLKNLRKTNYKVFEKTCKDLGIEYIFPPMYYRKAHRRWVAKKALCLRVRVQIAALVGPFWDCGGKSRKEGLSLFDKGMELAPRP